MSREGPFLKTCQDFMGRTSYAGWWLTYPSEKYESQWEGLSHMKWKIKAMFETTNQYINNVNPGLINNGLFCLGGYSSNSHYLILKWYPPNCSQP